MTNGSWCISFPDHPNYCEAILIIRQISGTFSLIGALFIISVIWLFKRYLIFAQRLTLYLSIASFLHSIAFISAQTLGEGPLCTFKGWYLTFFYWVVLLCVCCITFNLFMSVVVVTQTAKFELVYVAIFIGIPLIISLLPFTADVYGPSGSWCWIIPDTRWRVGIWYGPLFAIILVLISTYGFVIYTLLRKASTWEGTYDPDTHRQHELMKEDIKPLRFYPFIYLMVSMFPLINRIQNALSPDNHIFALVVLHTISSPLHGAINAIAFGLDKDTLMKLRPSEIKMALRSKLAPQSNIQEYPQPDKDTDQLEDTIEGEHHI